jgi:holdfast attachment protein HfaA
MVEDINQPALTPLQDAGRAPLAAVAAGAAALAVAAMLAGDTAYAQNNSARAAYGGSFERPYGYQYGQENQPYDAGTRDQNGNRVIVDGRIIVGDDLSSLPSGLYNFNGLTSGGSGFSGVGVGSAIGNQLNVITQGSHNIVIVDSTQINNGDQNVTINLNGGGQSSNVGNQSNANAASSVLNGEINLD